MSTSIKTTPPKGREGAAVITWELLLHQADLCQAGFATKDNLLSMVLQCQHYNKTSTSQLELENVTTQ